MLSLERRHEELLANAGVTLLRGHAVVTAPENTTDIDLTDNQATDNTQIPTNLPPPFDSFTLGANQQKTFAATNGFTLKASNAVQVASYLVSQHFVTEGYIGDPSQLLHPAAEQHRKDYVFPVPATFTKNYIVLAKPADAMVVVDGVPLAMQEDGVSFCYLDETDVVRHRLVREIIRAYAEDQSG